MKTNKEMFENIYDLLIGLNLDNSDTEWVRLHRKFSDEAKKDLRKFIGKKEMEWDGDKKTIKIGKGFTIQLIEE